MSTCPIFPHFREFLKALPPAPYKELISPRKRYCVKRRGVTFLVTDDAENAVIDYGEKTARLRAVMGVLAKKYPISIKW